MMNVGEKEDWSRAWNWIKSTSTSAWNGFTNTMKSVGNTLHLGATCTGAIFSAKLSEDCWNRLGNLNLGIGKAQLPIKATTDLLQFKLGTGYTEGWCGSEDLPSGWRRSGNKFTGCEVTPNFPGNNAYSVNSWARVSKEMKDLPRKQFNNEVWRGNELGFIISNEIFWPKVKPRSVLLGASVNQHIAVRPILVKLYGTCDASCKSRLKASARSVMNQGTIAVQADIKKWVFRELWKITFPGDNNPINADEFVEIQTKFTTYSTITQLMPDSLERQLQEVQSTSLENTSTK